MKKLVLMFVFVCMVALAQTTYTTGNIAVNGKGTYYTHFTIGPVRIDLNTGAVEFGEGYVHSEVSDKFWKLLADDSPTHLRAENEQLKERIRHLEDELGEDCPESESTKATSPFRGRDCKVSYWRVIDVDNTVTICDPFAKKWIKDEIASKRLKRKMCQQEKGIKSCCCANETPETKGEQK